jgi:hypothetical protein
MPLSDEEYRLLLEDAFDRHIRGRLRPPGYSPGLEGLLSNYREAILIANLLGQRRESEPPEATIFQPAALSKAQDAIVSAFDLAKTELEENGFLDALDENWPLIAPYIRSEHLPEADLELLRRLGDCDPGRGVASVIARLNGDAFPEFTTKSPRDVLAAAADSLNPARPAPAPPPRQAPAARPGPPRSRPRWWKGLGAIGSGSVLSLFNCGLALSLFAFPVAPGEQTVGAISSAATGIGLIMQGVGEFRRE